MYCMYECTKTDSLQLFHLLKKLSKRIRIPTYCSFLGYCPCQCCCSDDQDGTASDNDQVVTSVSRKTYDHLNDQIGHCSFHQMRLSPKLIGGQLTIWRTLLRLTRLFYTLKVPPVDFATNLTWFPHYRLLLKWNKWVKKCLENLFFYLTDSAKTQSI